MESLTRSQHPRGRFSILWATIFLAIALPGWYSAAKLTERVNPQTKEPEIIIKSQSGCTYLAIPNEQIRSDPVIAFAYVASYEKRVSYDISADALGWRKDGILARDPAHSYDSNLVATLSPYPNRRDLTTLTAAAFVVPAGLLILSVGPQPDSVRRANRAAYCAPGERGSHPAEQKKLVTSVILVTPALELTAYIPCEVKGSKVMKESTSEYRHEAVRLRSLIAEATTARARQHLEEQVRLNEKLAAGRSTTPQSRRQDAFKRAA